MLKCGQALFLNDTVKLASITASVQKRIPESRFAFPAASVTVDVCVVWVGQVGPKLVYFPGNVEIRGKRLFIVFLSGDFILCHKGAGRILEICGFNRSHLMCFNLHFNRIVISHCESLILLLLNDILTRLVT